MECRSMKARWTTQSMDSKLDSLQNADGASLNLEASTKRSRNGVVLVPQPSEDPRDPLVRLPPVCPLADFSVT